MKIGIYDKFPKMRIVRIVHRENQDGIQCLGCGMISYNENDIKNFYCGNCHKFGSLL